MPATETETLLKLVVGDVFDDSVKVSYEVFAKSGHDWRASLVSTTHPPRAVVLRATVEWFTIHVPALDVGHIEFDYDEVEGEKEQTLRELAEVARAYLDGEGRVDFKRGLIRRRRRPSLMIHIEGTEWVLGRRTSQRSRS